MSLRRLLTKHLRTSLCDMVESCFDIMKEKKLCDITVAEISKKASVHRSTFYRNFDSKEDIVKAFLTCLFAEYLSILQYSKPKNRQEYILLFFQNFYRYKTEMLLCYQNDLVSFLINMYEQKYLINIDNTETKLAAIYHYGGVYKLLLWWFDQGMRLSPEKLACMINSMQPIKLLRSDFMWQCGEVNSHTNKKLR